MRGVHKCPVCRNRYNRLAKHLRTAKHITARTRLHGKGEYVLPYGAKPGSPLIWQRGKPKPPVFA